MRVPSPPATRTASVLSIIYKKNIVQLYYNHRTKYNSDKLHSALYTAQIRTTKDLYCIIATEVFPSHYTGRRREGSIRLEKITCLTASLPDPCHFGVDPDPGIHASD
jgi:hypothetical protein